MALGVCALVPKAAANQTGASGATPRVGERRGPASMARSHQRPPAAHGACALALAPRLTGRAHRPRRTRSRPLPAAGWARACGIRSRRTLRSRRERASGGTAGGRPFSGAAADVTTDQLHRYLVAKAHPQAMSVAAACLPSTCEACVVSGGCCQSPHARALRSTHHPPSYRCRHD